ncbi:MAG: T9SS type A sorting domain-containing protein [Bacteroidales bacterium]|nr:T9SS type A sorting domain-containing protein [Bacteroidales bacterium]
MKNLYLFLSCLLISGVILAQPTLQYPENAPTIGDISQIQLVSPQGLSHLPIGADVSWDFSQLNNLTAGQITVIDPSDAPAGNEFPTANTALNMNDSIFTYCLIDETGFYYLGMQMLVVQNASLTKYTDSRKFMEYPFTYTDVFTDTYKGVITVEMANIEVRVSAISVATADSYGTLILPTGTYNNVLRTTTANEEIDSIFHQGSFMMVMLVSKIEYIWYSASSSTPLFNIMVSNSTGSLDTCCFYSTTGAGIIEADSGPLSKLNVFPNPASEELVVEFTSNGKYETIISIVNQIGQVMLSKEVPQVTRGLISEKIDISKLPSGIYFANVSCSSGKQLTKKLIIR